MPRRRVAAAALGLCLLAAPALAQERRPVQRQALADLAYVLGEGHAIRQVCSGQADQTFRDWMSRLIETEAPDDAFNRRLRDSFNAGFASAQAKYPACSAGARAAAVKSAERGKALSARMAGG